ncbi:MFS transporter [Gracilimonas mengyeensis]|uniref:MFS transporter, UMF1 family n=1 Tax=Gracilimonas mengyeensis TaxID=1302730 RepID=A0A521B9I6_9BACT|nr:MFS transporter [Gracilimonas mengyeensis]SMO43764.1 MFS transporter, UMF1 family [Gracilimonas mengyeensis]
MTKKPSKGLFAWAMYDWANSAYFVMIQTFVFATYFSQSIAENEISGTALWGNMIGLAAFVVAFSAPFLGAIADEGGRRKPWIMFFTVLCVFACSMLWFAEPSPEYIWFALAMAFLATVGAELSFIFYNAMLPDLTTSKNIGKWSGWGWGMGYAGGLVCLIVGYFGFVQYGEPLLGLSEESLQNVRITFVFTGLWYAVFSLPLFLKTPDTPSRNKSAKVAIKDGMKELKNGLKLLKEEPNIGKFLVARLFYNDGLATIFAMGGVYAAGSFGFDTGDIFIFGIALNITAGLGALVFSWMDDIAGSKRTILWALAGLTVPVFAVLLTESVTWFWIWGVALGIFVGPVQASSRTFMGRIAPQDKRNQMYGLFALSGKLTTFAGPLLVGWITLLADSQRWGMSAILLLLLIGLGLMFFVQDVQGTEREKVPINN